MMYLLPFWALNVVVPLLSMQGQKALGFHQKYLNLCSKDTGRAYRFGTTWGWVINDRILIFNLSPFKAILTVQSQRANWGGGGPIDLGIPLHHVVYKPIPVVQCQSINMHWWVVTLSCFAGGGECWPSTTNGNLSHTIQAEWFAS